MARCRPVDEYWLHLDAAHASCPTSSIALNTCLPTRVPAPHKDVDHHLSCHPWPDIPALFFPCPQVPRATQKAQRLVASGLGLGLGLVRSNNSSSGSSNTAIRLGIGLG
ncbi:unnamed protein product, partial [Discosporangium mesarthrocarpum]